MSTSGGAGGSVHLQWATRGAEPPAQSGEDPDLPIKTHSQAPGSFQTPILLPSPALPTLLPTLSASLHEFLSWLQRIEGTQMFSGIQWFGRSIHGVKDLGGDGLADVAVGAEGQVIVLR